MPPELRALATAQCGVFSRSQARNAGLRERRIKTLTASVTGAWVTIRRGVYAERAVWESADPAARHAMRVRAMVLVASTDAVVSHTSAAVLHGLPLRSHCRRLLHLTRPRVLGSRAEGGVKHHGAPLPTEDVTILDGIRVTTLARTALDVAREHGPRDGLIVADRTLKLGAQRQDLRRALEPMWCWPHVRAARQVADLADAGADNPGESLLRLMVVELGHGLPQTQSRIEVDGRLFFVDCRLGRHLFEFDGQVKFRPRRDGGVADVEPWRIAWQEKQREDALRRSGGQHEMSRVVWRELQDDTWRRTRARLADETDSTLRRFGPRALTM